MLARMPGYFESRLSSISLMVAASTSTVSAPDVNFRSGVGMTTLSDMICTPKRFFECCQLRLDYLRRGQIQCIQRLQPVSGNCENGNIRPFDTSLLYEFLSNRDSHSAGSLRKNTFCFG